ncbi:glycine--tRNA ligase subunit beta [Sphingomonas sp.]|uniref:glycine--tRNA ligase subunit beta n=1 Tax=Sphingomonas sp. TaxID=28214 RepID=UPI0025FB915A|nr:glycine--tRNA ligase subunit beta [Sphingomonas sp.]
MSDFLLELLSEEIPARMQARARNDLARMFAEALAKAGLAHGGVTTWSTPRRLVLIARDVPGETLAVREEVKGPRSSAPPQALEGFLRKTGLAREQLEERDGVWFAVIDRPGQSAISVLKVAVASIVLNFPWPKSMRWGQESKSTESLRWIRPLHNVLAFYGSEHFGIELDGFANLYINKDGYVSDVKQGEAGVTSLPSTFGHRFHHPGPITIGGASDYAEKLRACHVIVDHEEREAIIRKGAKAAAEAAGYALVEDEGLVVENAGLTEWPVPLLGTFDADYLDVPPEVIQLTARTNQKYFVMRGEEGALAPAFVCIANIAANDGGKAIVEGNRRVLAARLSDARFFWEQDVKVPLEEQAKKLSGIVFHEKLGTVADKVERVAKLAEWLVTEGIVKGASPADARRAAELCKADLVTGMVGEFPELQGVIGGYLAAAQGEKKAVSDAIRDHYKPVGRGDEVPTAPVTVAVSLADKLDTLTKFFDIDEAPTGSRDPYALRRAAIGVITLIINNDLRLSLAQAVTRALLPKSKLSVAGPPGLQLLNFLGDRLKVQQREAGVRHDLIDAVFALGGEDDLVRLLARVTALQSFIETPDGTDLHAGYKRAANILKKPLSPLASGESPSPARGEGSVPAEETVLVAALDGAEPRVVTAIEAEDFTGAMAALASLRAPIDAFFEGVTVNDPDPAIRERRLNLLARFRDAVHRVADFSKIEG